MAALPQKLIYSESALKIVTDPFIVGDELCRLANRSSRDFLAALDVTKLREPFVVLDILRGGRYYDIMDAWNQEIIQDKNQNYQLLLSEVRASRSMDSDGKWYAKVWFDDDIGISTLTQHESEHNLLNANTVFIGDTVATGSTLKHVLSWFVELRESHQIRKPIEVIVYSICGSSIAKKRLYPFYRDVLKPNNIEIELVFANAGYVLNERNGTDLSLITHEILPDAQAYISRRIGPEFLSKMKCAIWDWGNRFDEVDTHLHEIMEYFSTFYIHDLPEHIQKSVIKYEAARRSKQLRSKL